MKLQRGFQRFGMSLVALWEVFWTFAYVLPAHPFENATVSGPVFNWTTDIALIIAAVLAVPWIVSGFRSE